MQIYSNKVFENPIEIVDVRGDLEAGIRRVEELRKKYFLLGYITYDFKGMYFEAFEGFKEYTPKPPKAFGTIIKPKISKSEYVSAVSKIKDYIREGITYEVNYTYPSDVYTSLDGIDLYEVLLEKQRTPYNTFFQNKYTTLLSFSPELFFRLEGRKILTKPMKGTIKRADDGKDAERRDFLYHDTKNRAENIMIVDLLRNDLGRIAKTGRVKADKIFEIEEHPTVFQMTSEISAELRDDIGLYDVFRSIFPCGSITGAPKISTMRVIQELEPFERNIYCGAIGFLSPEVCEFSVPIRILYGGNYKYTYHAGGAVVWDSEAEDEWNETRVKTRFLETDFDLVETAVDDWKRHIERMKNSAEKLGFRWNNEIDELEKFDRILLHKDGRYEVQNRDFTPIENRLIRIGRRVNSNNRFLYHKTTIRDNPPEGLFDEIGINERGEITEGTFTNIAIEKDGELFTPPVECGLLNGTFRQKLIDEGKLKERIIYPEDLEKAERIFCFNSVRKMVEVRLCSS